MTQLTLVNLENVTHEEAATYKTRETARGIIFDAEGKIALVHETKWGCYELPGGGIEVGEDAKQALIREAKEELGCAVEIMGEVGFVVEYRKKTTLKQTSYCYYAKVVGEKGKPIFTQGEIENGFMVVWVSLEVAVKKLKEGNMEEYTLASTTARDVAFLEKVISKKIR